MKERSSLLRSLAAGLAVAGLALGAAAAHAGHIKASALHTAGLHGKGGHGFDFGRHGGFRPGHVKPKSVLTHRKRPDFTGRRGQKRRAFVVPGYGYGYSPGYRYAYTSPPVPITPSEAVPAAPPQPQRPVTPKWIHLGDPGVAADPAGAHPDGGLGGNCLSVKTEITVEGRPMEAFGKACLTADGAWVLRPPDDEPKSGPAED